jgi:predicted AAA+ superfamily ATPase
VETIHLWPVSQSEIHGSEVNVVDGLFAGRAPRIVDAPRGRDAFVEAIVAGGFPEARGRSPRRREQWSEDYVRSTVERDLRDLSDAHKLAVVPQLLRALAARAGSIVDHEKVAQRLGVDPKTAKSYTSLLELVFLVRTVPAWRPGITAREGKKPKVHLVDTCLLLSLLGADERRLREDDQITGKAVENFVAMEIVKHLEWAETRANLYHYRGSNQEEIDLVLESRSGEIVAVEAKAAASVTARDLRQLGRLRDRRPDAFRAGVLFYAGKRTLPFGDRLWAVPFSGLWGG